MSEQKNKNEQDEQMVVVERRFYVDGEFNEKMASWGKSVGGAVALGIMLVTNFIIDAPFINWINKKATDVVDKFDKNKQQKNEAKEVK